MKKTNCIAAVFVVGMMLASWPVFAQAVPAQPADAPDAAAAATVPLDQQPSKEQLTKLFELMRVQEQVASVTKIMPELLQEQFSTQLKQLQKSHPELASKDAAQRQAVTKIMSKYIERSMNLYPPDEMVADMGTLYQKHLTRSDVEGIIAFYSSPAGQHMLDMVPVIMQEFMPMVMQRMDERMQPMIDQMTKEMEGQIKSHAAHANKPDAK